MTKHLIETYGDLQVTETELRRARHLAKLDCGELADKCWQLVRYCAVLSFHAPDVEAALHFIRTEARNERAA